MSCPDALKYQKVTPVVNYTKKVIVITVKTNMNITFMAKNETKVLNRYRYK